MALSRKKVVLAKIELEYGTDATPTGEANAIEIQDPSITPLAGDTIDRRPFRQSLGASLKMLANQHVLVSFAVFVAGSGTAGTAPPYGTLLRMCGLQETLTPDTSAAYKPRSAGYESGTIWFNEDGTKHALLGARGNARWEFQAKQFPRIVFDFVGLLVPAAAAALPTPDFSAWQDPLPVSKTNTPAFTLHGYAAVLEALTINLGNQVVHRDLVNSRSVQIADRQASGSITIETPPIATKDFFAAASASTLGALALTHGTAAGNIAELALPQVQVMNPRYGESDGISTLMMDLNIVPDAGDDEIAFTVK